MINFKNFVKVARQTALEFLLTLSETAPGMIRKYNQLHQALIPIVLEWVAELDDSPDWYTTDNVNY